MVNSLVGRKSFFWLYLEHFADKILGELADPIKLGNIKGVCSNAHLFHNLLVVLAIEGRDSGQKDVKDNTA